jgi:hypothetical protein
VKPNPPIRGHKLLHEGHRVRTIDPLTEMYAGWSYGCECGAEPDYTSINATKRWHRAHKAAMRSGVTP